MVYHHGITKSHGVPMRRLPPLNPLLAFEATSRHLSFTKAARELNVTQGAVSRQVAVLENYFGRSLFERHSNSIALTPSAAPYAGAINKVFGDLRAATEAYVAASARHTLTVKGYPLFLSHWLMPRLPQFAQQIPRIDVRLVAMSGASHVDFAKDRVDVGIRYGRGSWAGLESHCLFTDELLPVCTPALAGKLRLRQPKDLVGQVLLQTRDREADWLDWFALAGITSSRALERAMSFEDLGLVHQCTLDGIGIAIIQRPYVQDDLAARRLVVPFGPVLRRRLGYYLVYPTDRANVREIEAFRRWLLGTTDRT